MKQYAVWVCDEFDTADWYTDHDAAFDAWHALAQAITDGESAYLQRFDANGEPDEDYPHELRRDGADVLEYYNGARVWA
jgi:hypothetical protein